MSKILGIDYGTQRVGIALSDDGWKFSFAYDTFDYSNKNNINNYLRDLCKKEEVVEIVIGMPLDQDGNKGKKAGEVIDFSNRIKEELGIPIFFEDERFTSVMAKKLIHEADKKHKKNKGMIDQEAAKLILQTYLDKKNG